MLVVTNCIQDTIHTIPFNFITFHDWSYDLVTIVREQLFANGSDYLNTAFSWTCLFWTVYYKRLHFTIYVNCTAIAKCKLGVSYDTICNLSYHRVASYHIVASYLISFFL